VNIDSIENGIVLDHIKAGTGLAIYRKLRLDELSLSVAIIQNAKSEKLGRKDIIKINEAFEVDLDVLGYIDPDITVNVIQNGKLAEKRHLALPKRLVNVIQCKNPRCITTTEQEIDHIFELVNANSHTYRCLYCEAERK